MSESSNEEFVPDEDLELEETNPPDESPYPEDFDGVQDDLGDMALESDNEEVTVEGEDEDD